MNPSFPVVVLVKPQLGENVGAAARAMYNCGLDDLRLVSPRHDLDYDRARALAMMAKPLVENMTICDTTGAALADVHGCLATTARIRHLERPVMTPRNAARYMMEQSHKGRRLGVLFGCEASGLDNEDISLAEAIISVPLEQGRRSLNLAQAVLLIAYEWRLAVLDESPPVDVQLNEHEPARHATMQALFELLEQSLRHVGFLQGDTKEERCRHRLRHCLWKAQLTEDEAHMWHGVMRALAHNHSLTPKPQLFTTKDHDQTHSGKT